MTTASWRVCFNSEQRCKLWVAGLGRRYTINSQILPRYSTRGRRVRCNHTYGTACHSACSFVAVENIPTHTPTASHKIEKNGAFWGEERLRSSAPRLANKRRAVLRHGRQPTPLAWRDKKTRSWKSDRRFKNEGCFCFLLFFFVAFLVGSIVPKRASLRSDKDGAVFDDRFEDGNLWVWQR